MLRSRIFWLIVLVPVVVIGVIELVADWVLDPFLPFPYDTLVLVAGVMLLAVSFAAVATRTIARLSGALDARTGELQARDATARELHQVSVAIAGTHDLDAILQVVAEGARQALAADVAFVVLQTGETPGRVAAQSGPPGLLIESTLDGVAEPVDLLPEAYRAAMLAAPLRSGGETIGSLAVACARPRAFGVDDVETLSSLANQLALAIDNARLEGRLREVAVRSERERIAREMHDGLAQVLGYVNTKSQAVEELLAAGQQREARAQLTQLAGAARSIYVDVREAILGLTSPVTPERGLVGAVEEYVARFAEASKLATVVRADPAAATVALAPEVEAQAFRIVQEALTNVRKHASAQRVEVELELQDAVLRISVTDDGRGIRGSAGNGDARGTGRAPEPEPTLWPHYGLTAMRERASAIGAQLTVSGSPGRGTTIRLAVPIGARIAAGGV